MRIIKLFSLSLVCGCLIVSLVGCAELDDLRVQNNLQRKRMVELEGDLQATKIKLDQATRKLADAENLSSIETDALQQEIAALNKDVEEKETLIARMQKQLLSSGAPSPVELTTLLEDFAIAEEMVTYDSKLGIVKFRSDLLFERGSDRVAPDAVSAIGGLCKILNTDQAKEFDIIIAGHTDDIPIRRPATIAKHASNWHLSSHRAIAVLKTMERKKIVPRRMSTRGFGEYQPIADNKAGKKGNAKNRRVEIYIVAKGT